MRQSKFISKKTYLRSMFLTMTAGLLFLSPVLAQSNESAMQKALRLEAEHRDSAALVMFRELLEKTPQDVMLLNKCSKLSARVGGRQPETSFKRIADAKNFALRAILLDSLNAEAHFNYIVSLGLLSSVADNPKEKLQHARIIRQEAETVIRLDPNFASAYFVLGKWNEVLSGLSMFERLVANTLFGGIPEGASYQSARLNYERAVSLQPDFILFHYGLASALLHEKKPLLARKTLEHALSLPEVEPDDVRRKENCRKLLREIKSQRI